MKPEGTTEVGGVKAIEVAERLVAGGALRSEAVAEVAQRFRLGELAVTALFHELGRRLGPRLAPRRRR